MSSVTYLLGAGASFDGVPTVENMADGIGLLSAYLSGNMNFIPGEIHILNGNQITVQTILSNAIRDLNEIRQVCRNYSSIDTYAKRLYLSGDEKKYNKLKATISLFISLYQIIYPLDKRYDNFWASILNSPTKLPSKLKIVSWNYDSQLEQSFHGIVNVPAVSDISDVLNMQNADNLHLESLNSGQFGIVKINGSAKFRENKKIGEYYFSDLSKEKTLLQHISDVLYNYDKIVNGEGFLCSLNFAWENKNIQNLTNSLMSFLHETKTLVIIGYSYPYFNRLIDQAILESMPGLKRVYIQNPDAEVIKERFQELSMRVHTPPIRTTIEYKLVLDKKQFFFPNDLEV